MPIRHSRRPRLDRNVRTCRHLRPVVLAVSLIVLPRVAAPAAAAVTAGASVTVRVYEVADVPDADLHTAQGVAGRTLSQASMEVAWKNCASSGVPPSGALPPEAFTGDACAVPRTSGELSVRIVRAAGVPRAGQVRPLGDALVDAASGSGVLATIYLDRVEWLAAAAGVDRATVLGRAIAHEIGHLLLGSTGHSAGGLMRPLWSRDEVRRDRAHDWAFTTRDVAAMHARRRGY